MDDEAKKKADLKKQIQLIKQKYRNKVTSPRNQPQQPINDQPMHQEKQQKKEGKSQLERQKQSDLKDNAKQKKQNILRDIFARKEQKRVPQESQKSIEEILSEKINDDPFKLGSIVYPDTNNTKECREDQQIQLPLEIENYQTGVSEEKEFSLSLFCQRWLNSPLQCLQILLKLEESSTISDFPSLKSSNPSFPGIVQHFVKAFILKSSHPFSQEQKTVIYNLGLEYFTPSPHILSDILLICLIKLGYSYSRIYGEQIIKKIEYYSRRIIKFKHLLLNEEITELILNLLQQFQDSLIKNQQIEKIVYLLALKPDLAALHHILLNQNITDPKFHIAILCLLKPDNTRSLSLLYVKCLNELVPVFKQIQMLQNVIKHINEVKVPESLYQAVKTLKLKLIAASDEGKGLKKKQENENSGIMGYWNKAITKISGKSEKNGKEERNTFVAEAKNRGTDSQ